MFPRLLPFRSYWKFFYDRGYQFHLENFQNGNKMRNIYQFRPMPTVPDQKHRWHFGRMETVAVPRRRVFLNSSKQVPECGLYLKLNASSFLIALMTKTTLENIQKGLMKQTRFALHSWICLFERLASKIEPEFDVAMHNKEPGNVFNKKLLLKLKRYGNEKI